MSELFFSGIQQDFKIFLLAPILCAVFRAIFILRYWPYESYAGKGPAIYHCFRYGFWWGMDWNAYIFGYSFLLITLPGLFFPAYYAVGDFVRSTVVVLYSIILYTAFLGKRRVSVQISKFMYQQKSVDKFHRKTGHAAG